jgi:L-iditol 2-dehydrogenase
MKSAYLTGSQTFEIRQTSDPTPPPGGLVLRVDACGVCGSDLRRWKEGPAPGTEPVVPGHEIAGEVLAVAPDHTQFKVGDRLAVAPDIHCGNCYYCERGLYNLCDQLHFLGITPGYPGGFSTHLPLTQEVLQNGVVHPIPDGMPSDWAALSEPCSSVLSAHEQAGTSLKDTVVVMGAGPIGCLHVAIAKSRGASVILSEPSEIRRRLAEPFGADVIINPYQQDLESITRRATVGVGADIVVCANPIAATQTQAVQIVRKRGKVLLFGGLPKKDPLTTLDGNRIHYGEISVVGSFSYHPTYHALALQIIQRGVISIPDIVTHHFSLDNVRDAFQAASSGEALKVLVTF